MISGYIILGPPTSGCYAYILCADNACLSDNVISQSVIEVGGSLRVH